MNFKFLERKAMKTTKTFLKKLKKIVEEKIEDARLICLYEKIGEPMNTSAYSVASHYSYSGDHKRAKEAILKAYRGGKYGEPEQKGYWGRNGGWAIEYHRKQGSVIYPSHQENKSKNL
jgi:hypothetical protein